MGQRVSLASSVFFSWLSSSSLLLLLIAILCAACCLSLHILVGYKPFVFALLEVVKQGYPWLVHGYIRHCMFDLVPVVSANKQNNNTNFPFTMNRSVNVNLMDVLTRILS